MAQKTENPRWGKGRKYKMGQQQKIHAVADADNTSGPHDESPHGGGRHHVVRVAPHKVAR